MAPSPRSRSRVRREGVRTVSRGLRDSDPHPEPLPPSRAFTPVFDALTGRGSRSSLPHCCDSSPRHSQMLASAVIRNGREARMVSSFGQVAGRSGGIGDRNEQQRARAGQAQGHRLPRPVEPRAVRGRGAGLLQEAQSRGRDHLHAELHRAAQRPRAGSYDIAHGGVDNAVAQVENDKTDLFIFMGGNSGLNSLFVQPEIKSYEQLRGTTMAVDAPNTAFALLLYKMLDVKGIKRSDYKVRAGRRDASAARGDAEGQDLFGGDAVAARLDPGGEGRPQGSRLGGQRRRAVSVRRRLGAALLGQGQCRHAHALHPGQCRRHPLGARSREPRRADRRSSRRG